MMTFIWNSAAFVIALGILVTVLHEFGTFKGSRRCGIFVERFSVGFGKALWRRTDKHGTEFVIAMIPLGGYMSKCWMSVAPVAPERRHQAFNNKTVGQRAAVVMPGRSLTFVSHRGVLDCVYDRCTGGSSGRGGYPRGVGRRTGKYFARMELNAVDGIETPDWNSVRMAMISKIGDNFTVLNVVPEPGQPPRKNASISPAGNLIRKNRMLSCLLGIMPVSAKVSNEINALTPGPVEKTGLQTWGQDR